MRIGRLPNILAVACGLEVIYMLDVYMLFLWGKGGRPTTNIVPAPNVYGDTHGKRPLTLRVAAIDGFEVKGCALACSRTGIFTLSK